jgi:spore maturation protein CgeB
MKYTEYLACGGFLLADKPDEMKHLGYVNNKHFVIYDNMKDLRKKIIYYMSHDAERNKIAKQGMNFVRKNHSCEVRVKEMTKIIKEVLNV